MAAPTSPDLISLTTEGLKKVSSSPGALQLQRAQDQWMEEIKNDIWLLAKKLKPLQTTNIFVITKGEGLIAYPSDFSSDLSMVLMDGLHFGVCQAGGSSTTVVLASDEDLTSAFAIGKEIVIYLTATKITAFSGYISAYDSTTKVATFSLAISVSPDATYSYLIVDSYKPLVQKQVLRLDQLYTHADRGTPQAFYPVGDEDSGNFYLFPVPYRTNDNPWAIRQRYYADLLTLDLAGTLMATLYKRWRNLFIQGVYAKALQDEADAKNFERADKEMAKYRSALSVIVGREQEGLDLSNMQMRVQRNDV